MPTDPRPLSSVNCPFCIGEIHPDATVCPHCRSELGPLKPLLQRLEEMDRKWRASESDRAALAERVALLEQAALSGRAAMPSQLVLSEELGSDESALQFIGLRTWCLGVGTTMALLGLVHFLLLFVYDARPVVLRAVTLLVPMGAALLMLRGRLVEMPRLFLGAAILGVGSVILMLAITAFIDQVPLVPTSLRDWRETIEYALGIALSFAAGGWLLRTARSWSEMSQTRNRHAHLKVQAGTVSQIDVKELAGHLQRLLAVLGPVATGVTAFYSGFKGVMGS